MKRRGFTLVELLVVIAIIGVLVALLLPAVQAAREAARRSQCINNLKQIGLGFHNHHDTYQIFPNGGWRWQEPPRYVNGVPQVGPDQHAGWGFQILPYIEQVSLWDGGTLPNDADKQRQAIQTPVDTFFCPSRRLPTAHRATSNWYAPSGTFPHAQTDYAGSQLQNQNGVVVRVDPPNRRKVSFAQIIDGSSNTLVVGEKRLNVSRLNDYQSDDNEGYTSGWDHDVMRRTNRAPRPDLKSGSGHGDERFGSSHPGGFNALFGDGRVAFVKYEIDLTTFERLGDRRDGNPVTIP